MVISPLNPEIGGDTASPSLALTFKNMKYNLAPKETKQVKGSWEEIAKELWGLLDSIDTLPDMIHPNTFKGHEKCWKMMVKRAEKRHKLLKTDGYKLSKSSN